MPSNPQNERATPYRRTHLRLDTPDTSIVEVPFVRSWALDQMAQGPSAQANGVHFLKEIGWELEVYQVNESNTRERTEAQGGLFGVAAGDLFVDTTYVERPTFRSPTDLLDATSGASANLVSEGDIFLERQVAAGESWSAQRLTADQAAYPPPEGSTNIVMDRVAVTGRSMTKSEPIVYRFWMPGNGSQAPDRTNTFYFPGPAGGHATRVRYVAGVLQEGWVGTGQYALEFGGDGTVRLREKCKASVDGKLWSDGVVFRYAPAMQVSGRQHTVYIRCVTDKSGVSRIYIKCSVSTQNNSLGMFAVVDRRAQSGTVTEFVYRVPQPPQVFAVPPAPPPSRATPLRVDVRRDLRPKVQMSRARYKATGTLKCDPFSVPFWPGSTNPLRMIWLADLPEGTSITCQLYDARTGNALPIHEDAGGNPVVGDYYTEFDIEFGMDYFYAIFTLTADESGYRSPILIAERAQRDGRTVTVAPTEVDLVPFTSTLLAGQRGLVQRTFGPVSISTSGGEPHQQSGTTKVVDVINSLDLLKTRSEIPFVMETEYDSVNPALRSVLMEGYVEAPVRNRKRARGTVAVPYPAAEWSEYRLQLIGKWLRITEQYSNVKWNWHWPDPDRSDGAPYKATDALRTMLNWCGFPVSAIDVPDLPIRLWPAPDMMDLFIEPGAPLMQFVMAILKEYLGGAILWDPNAGAAGKIRVIIAPRPPYRRFCRFVRTPPSGGGVRIAHQLNAWGTWTDTNPHGLTIPQYPALVTSSRRTERPEANCVLVTGVSLGDWTSYKRLSQWAINTQSFNFYAEADTADPTSPDYLSRMVPLFVIDPGLNTPKAVGWACRRYFDIACRATLVETIACHLSLFTDAEDDEQTKPRPLRQFDPVALEWDDNRTWLVRQPTIDYRKDFSQMQVIEVQRPEGPFADGPFAD